MWLGHNPMSCCAESRRILRRAVLTLMLVLSTSVAVGCDRHSPKEQQARDLVERFCRSEFGDGSSVDTAGMLETRYGIVKYSPKGVKQAERAGLFIVADEPVLLSYDDSPLYVVKSLRIENVSVTGNKAMATVFYNRLARTKGHGDNRQLIPDHIRLEKVRLSLIYEDKWHIYDPPLPRISLDTMLAYYQPIIEEYPDEDPEIYQHYDKTYKVLDQIRQQQETVDGAWTLLTGELIFLILYFLLKYLRMSKRRISLNQFMPIFCIVCFPIVAMWIRYIEYVSWKGMAKFAVGYMVLSPITVKVSHWSWGLSRKDDVRIETTFTEHVILAMAVGAVLIVGTIFLLYTL